MKKIDGYTSILLGFFSIILFFIISPTWWTLLTCDLGFQFHWYDKIFLLSGPSALIFCAGYLSTKGFLLLKSLR